MAYPLTPLAATNALARIAAQYERIAATASKAEQAAWLGVDLERDTREILSRLRLQADDDVSDVVRLLCVVNDIVVIGRTLSSMGHTLPRRSKRAQRRARAREYARAAAAAERHLAWLVEWGTSSSDERRRIERLRLEAEHQRAALNAAMAAAQQPNATPSRVQRAYDFTLHVAREREREENRRREYPVVIRQPHAWAVAETIRRATLASPRAPLRAIRAERIAAIAHDFRARRLHRRAIDAMLENNMASTIMRNRAYLRAMRKNKGDADPRPTPHRE
jgi:predicted ATP-dependent protease